MSTHGSTAVKSRRQHAILSLVAGERLSSQDQIRRRLADLGFEATQSTISRDIEELGLARVHDHDGVRYVLPGHNGQGGTVRLRRLLEEFATAFQPSGNLLLIRTPPGAASALAEGLDHFGPEDVAGTIAGDNTILLVAREGVSARELERQLRDVMEVAP